MTQERTVVMTLTDAQIDRIRLALKSDADAIRKQASNCARAVGKWNDPAVKRLVDEAQSAEYLSVQFKHVQNDSIVRVKA